jgi:hypothetical protein
MEISAGLTSNPQYKALSEHVGAEGIAGNLIIVMADNRIYQTEQSERAGCDLQLPLEVRGSIMRFYRRGMGRITSETTCEDRI